ncbi:2534_t:CDS:2, partial [Diversispora eburnea]
LFEILISSENKEYNDIIRQSDAEENDIGLEQEMQQINEEFSQ